MRVVAIGVAIIACLSYSAATEYATAGVSSGCVRPQTHRIASGTGPRGRPWTVTAMINNVVGCRIWLLGIKVSPTGPGPGTWRDAWAIPAHGRLPKTFGLAADDESSGAKGVFSGVVGERIRTVSKNERRDMVRHSPSSAISQVSGKLCVLRGLRYFIRFYAVDRHVRCARLLDARGQLVRIVRGSEGEFDGFH